MSISREDAERLAAKRWVHVFEEDTPEGAVYRPEDDNIPLSRRPREQLQFAADGSVRVFMPGQDDRLVAQPAAAAVEIVQHSPSRLVVRMGPGPRPR
jgi:hypothetical protein